MKLGALTSHVLRNRRGCLLPSPRVPRAKKLLRPNQVAPQLIDRRLHNLLASITAHVVLSIRFSHLSCAPKPRRQCSTNAVHSPSGKRFRSSTRLLSITGFRALNCRQVTHPRIHAPWFPKTCRDSWISYLSTTDRLMRWALVRSREKRRFSFLDRPRVVYHRVCVSIRRLLKRAGITQQDNQRPPPR